MDGTMITINPDGDVVRKHFKKPPTVEMLQKEVGWSIEYFSLFTKWHHEERRKWVPCTVYLNGNGKLIDMPTNHLANQLWFKTLEKVKSPLVKYRTLPWGDVEYQLPDRIVGPMVVLIGDHRFRNA